MYVEHDGRIYKTSSFSDRSRACVGVSIQEDSVFVMNTRTKEAVLQFTHEEWKAFVSGIKAGEFGIEEESS